MAIHFNMNLNHEFNVIGDWFKIHYITNEGMAFGLKLGGAYGKLILTSFRWLVMVGIVFFMSSIYKKQHHFLFMLALAFILGGATGNIIDSTFYGILLEGNVAVYETNPPLYPLFYGKVIDMIYLDIWKGIIPTEIPIIGGIYYAFWPIFNIADSSVFIGAILLFLSQKRQKDIQTAQEQ